MADTHRREVLPTTIDLAAYLDDAAAFGWSLASVTLVSGPRPKVVQPGRPLTEPPPAFLVILRRPEWAEGIEQASREAMSRSLADMLEREIAAGLVDDDRVEVRREMLRKLLAALRGVKVIAAAQPTTGESKEPKAL